jgi:hypothetical protein
VAAPKLNGLGEAFRLAAYSLPDDPLLRPQTDSVTLGAEPWRDLWPQGIWPGKIPGSAPLAVRFQTDVTVVDQGSGAQTDFRFPHEFYLLAAASFDETFSFFFEGEWSESSGFEVPQARFMVQDIIPGLPDRALNLWVGKQDLFLFTFADRQIDRAGRQVFSWQRFSPSRVTLQDGPGGNDFGAENSFALGSTQAAIELNGLLGPRFYWGAGIGQGVSEGSRDLNGRKDLYYKVRYKLGGLPLNGVRSVDDTSLESFGGQFRERALILEHFGYRGAEPTPDGRDDRHTSFGFALRGLHGPLDIGLGWVGTEAQGSWDGLPGTTLRTSSPFAKLEYAFFPWLFGSFKGEYLRFSLPDSDLPGIEVRGATDGYRVVPGAYALLRQNVRVVAEVDLPLSDPPEAMTGPRDWGFFLRLDLAF